MSYRHIDEMERERIANWPAPRTRMHPFKTQHYPFHFADNSAIALARASPVAPSSIIVISSPVSEDLNFFAFASAAIAL